MAKHSDRLAETKGVERYDFEKRLVKDAKKFASRNVLGDMAFVGAIALGGYIGYRAARDNWEWQDVVNQAESYAIQASDTIQDLIHRAIQFGDRALMHVGNKIADGAGVAIVAHGKTLFHEAAQSAPMIGRGLALGVRGEMDDAVARILHDIEARSATVGSTLTSTMLGELMVRMPSLLQELEASARRAGEQAGTGFSLGVMEQMPGMARVAGESFRGLGWTILTGSKRKNP